MADNTKFLANQNIKYYPIQKDSNGPIELSGKKYFENFSGKKIVFPNSRIPQKMFVFGLATNQGKDLIIEQTGDHITYDNIRSFIIYGEIVYNGELFLATYFGDASDSFTMPDYEGSGVAYSLLKYVKYTDVKQYIQN